MTSIFAELAKYSGYLQKGWVIALAIAAAAAVIGGLAPLLRYTRATGFILRVFGILFLACGLILAYAKFRVSTVKVPSTWVWIPAIGITFLIAAWFLHRQRMRAVHGRIGSLAAATVERIDVLIQRYRTTNLVDLVTSDGKSATAQLSSAIRRSRRPKCIILSGLLGSGKTTTLLSFAADCQQMRSTRRRPIIAIYVDLIEYCMARTANQDLLLAEFIQGKFHGLDVSKAWVENGRDVRWVFLFDNADDADLRWGYKEQSWQLITSFVRERSRSAPFYAVMASRIRPETVPPDYVIRLNGLTWTGWQELLMKSGINEEAVNELAKDKSFRWHLSDPGTLRLLAPILTSRVWATGDDVRHALTTADKVHKVMGDAVAHRLRTLPQSQEVNLQSLQTVALATIKFLQTDQYFAPDVPGEVGTRLTNVAGIAGSLPQQIDENLTTLATCGIVKLTLGPENSQYVEFMPAVGAYFYTCSLLEEPDTIPVRELLTNRHFRLTAVSLLRVADSDIVARFIQETEQLLDSAINSLLAESIPSDTAVGQTELRQLTYFPYAALSILVDGLQYRFEVLDKELREKTIEFTQHAMRFANPQIQAGLLEVSHTLGTREQAISAMKAGLNSKDGAVVFRSAGMVNALSENEVNELEDVHRSKLISVIIIVGLRSLILGRERDDVPSGLRHADDAGTAAIILYGTIFGIGGILQLINFWHYPFHNPWHYPIPQVCEVLAAVLVAGSITLSRYATRWRIFVLRHDFQTAMKRASGFLAIVGTAWAAGIILQALWTFTMPLMPILVCYSLIWPACALSYLMSDRNPTITNIIFPLPRVIETLWREKKA